MFSLTKMHLIQFLIYMTHINIITYLPEQRQTRPRAFMIKMCVKQLVKHSDQSSISNERSTFEIAMTSKLYYF